MTERRLRRRFAWFPVYLSDLCNPKREVKDRVWLEYVIEVKTVLEGWIAYEHLQRK